MELDNLKAAWQAGEQPLPSMEDKNMTEITEMIEGRVSGVLARQSRRYWWLIVQTAVMPVIVTALFYLMSDGFTDESDPIGALFVLLVAFIPPLILFISRYRASQSHLLSVGNNDVRTQLPKTIATLRRYQWFEVGVVSVLILLGVGGGIAMAWGSVGIFLFIAVLACAGLGVAFTIWRQYQHKLNELDSCLQQLSTN